LLTVVGGIGSPTPGKTVPKCHAFQTNARTTIPSGNEIPLQIKDLLTEVSAIPAKRNFNFLG
jgi:hypothetical protein